MKKRRQGGKIEGMLRRKGRKVERKTASKNARKRQ